MAATTMGREQFIEWLRSELPRLLQEDPRFSAEVVGILSQALGSRAEFHRLLEEIGRLREDMERRFAQLREDLDRRFETLQQVMDRRFEATQRDTDRRSEALQQETSRRFEAIVRTLLAHSEELARHGKALRRIETGLGGPGRRMGAGFEESVRATIEELSGVGPLQAERLVIRDVEGELFGVQGQTVEFDAFVHDGRRFLVEVKSFAEPEDVLNFFRKVQFARGHLGEPFEALLIAPFALKRAAQLAQELGIRLLMHGDEDSPESR